MTIRELAGKLGVSASTVSMVMNGKGDISPQTRKLVEEGARKYGYEPQKRKPSVRGRILLIQYRASGYLVEENQGFMSAIIDAIERNLKIKDFGLSIRNVSGNLRDELEAIDYGPYRGAVLIASEIAPSMYGDISSIKVPFVVVDNPVPDCRFACVGINNTENTRIAVEYLKKKGFRRIGLLSSSEYFENFRVRCQAFLEKMEEAGLEFAGPEYPLRPDMKGAREDMLRCLEQRGVSNLPDAFFAVNDIIALGAIRALKERGVFVPGNVSVIGFDDIPYAAVSSPTLTTIHVQRRFIGYETVRELMERIENPEADTVKVEVTGRLIERRSVGAMHVRGTGTA